MPKEGYQQTKNHKEKLRQAAHYSAPTKRKRCEICERFFLPTSTVQKYCSQKCRNNIQYPFFICQNCEHKFRLDFFPTTTAGRLLLNTLRCPKCHQWAQGQLR